MRFDRLIIAGMIFMLLLMPPVSVDAAAAAAGPEASAPGAGMAAPSVEIALEDGLLYLDVRNAEIGEVLRAIGEKAGIGLSVGEGVRGRISLGLAGVSLEEALRRLCESRAILYEYDPETRTGRIVGAGAFAAAPGSPAGTRTDAAMPAPTAAIAAGQTPKEGAAPPAGALLQPPAGRHREIGGDKRFHDRLGRPLYKLRELLVQFRPDATAEQMAALHRRLGSRVLKSHDRLKLQRIRLPEGMAEEEGIVLYSASEIVAVAERHAIRYPLIEPNDPYYANHSQWGMNKIQMPAAWERTTGLANIVVGVIDTGVDAGHPDLSANIWMNPGEIPGNGVDDDHNGYVDDVRGWDFAGTAQGNGDQDPMDKTGHGTHVAGIIAAVGNNGIGVAGIGWNLRIIPLKIVTDSSSEMLVDDIVEAIDYAIARHVRIVNCSFGGEGDFSQTEYNAFNRLRWAGILAVCAAGNGGIDNDIHARRMYPASYDLDNIISVAASLNPDQPPLKPENLWDTSSYGRISVDLMAPGENIYSTHLCPAGGDCCPESGPCGTYYNRSGTSMAAPHVTGVAGLILSRNAGLGYGRVKSVILESVDPVPAVSNLLVSGGRLNALSALSRSCLPGAVTGGEEIGLGDVIAALRTFSGMDTALPVCRTADVDGDDRIGLAEAVYGLQRLSALRSE